MSINLYFSISHFGESTHSSFQQCACWTLIAYSKLQLTNDFTYIILICLYRNKTWILVPCFMQNRQNTADLYFNSCYSGRDMKSCWNMIKSPLVGLHHVVYRRICSSSKMMLYYRITLSYSTSGANYYSARCPMIYGSWYTTVSTPFHAARKHRNRGPDIFLVVLDLPSELCSLKLLFRSVKRPFELLCTT